MMTPAVLSTVPGAQGALEKWFLSVLTTEGLTTASTKISGFKRASNSRVCVCQVEHPDVSIGQELLAGADGF